MSRSTRSAAPKATAATATPATRGRPKKQTTTARPEAPPEDSGLADTVASITNKMGQLEEGQSTVKDMLGSILRHQREAALTTQDTSPDARTAPPRSRAPSAVAPQMTATADDDLTPFLPGSQPTYSTQAYDPLFSHHVRSLLNTAHVMTNKKGKRSHPHQYVFRGPTREKTTLVSLDLAEYLFGLQQLTKDPRTPAGDKPALAKHLNDLVTDAKEYNWPQVREWSETVFSSILEEEFTWSAELRIDSLRNTIAHVRGGRRYSTDHPSTLS